MQAADATNTLCNLRTGAKPTVVSADPGATLAVSVHASVEVSRSRVTGEKYKLGGNKAFRRTLQKFIAIAELREHLKN